MERPPLVDVEQMRFEAKAALIVHTLNPGKEAGDDEMGLYERPALPTSFVTIHAIRSGQICEGSSITRNKLLRLCKSVMPSLSARAAFIPEHVIAYSPINTTLLWWRPAGVSHLFFDKCTGVPSGRAPLPPLLFRYSGIGLTTFCLKQNRRPDPSTELFYSVFPNFGCMGNVKIPGNPTPASTEKLEELFFRAAFTDHNGPRIKGVDWRTLWQSLVNSGKPDFPLDCLAPAGKVGDLFTRNADDFTD